jgi:hypothetical protein
LGRPAEVVPQGFQLENSIQNPPEKKVVNRPTIRHVGFFFVRVVSKFSTLVFFYAWPGG